MTVDNSTILGCFQFSLYISYSTSFFNKTMSLDISCPIIVILLKTKSELNVVLSQYIFNIMSKFENTQVKHKEELILSKT